ncbi:hypothetical protein GGS21DRAFT_489107 [Xylaria nigripes]|nr:hypothetical protein GGS21DRAFT_489107 [Xylaria nigripes]
MLSCRACLARSFDPLYGHTRAKSLKTSRSNLQALTRLNRRYATHTSSSEVTDLPLIQYSGNYVKKAPETERSVRRAARKELEYLTDPYHIAHRVSDALKQDNLALAVHLTKESSRNNKVTVSWNNLIDYQIQKGRLHAALKLYNEMKKRAQLPNAQTFTIIFRGCAESPHPKLAIGEAIKLYQNMSNGHIKPNTIHLNAVLQVCAKVEDIDSMFSILKNSDDPLQSPNNLTYTIILNALRAVADKEPLGEEDPRIRTEEQITEEKKNAVKHAKAIWDEVMSRWTSGSIFIDEELVCAMGRVLLLGDYKDADTVESLIEQTILKPRQAEKRNQKKGRTIETALKTAGPDTTPRAPGVSYALPGNNSLSLLLEATYKTRKTTKAIAYWNIFTIKYNVVPDGDNWNHYLRAIRLGKNSSRAATILQKMPSNMVRNKHIRHALKTCLRDNLNRSSLSNATKILETMGRVPSVPDVRALRTYLQVAHAFKRSFDREARLDYTAAMASWAQQLALALEKLFGAYQSLVKKYDVVPPKNVSPSASRHIDVDKAEILSLERKMCAAYDILTHEHAHVLTQLQLNHIRSRHAGISRRITKYYGETWAKDRAEKRDEEDDDEGDEYGDEDGDEGPPS